MPLTSSRYRIQDLPSVTNEVLPFIEFRKKQSEVLAEKYGQQLPVFSFPRIKVGGF